MDANSLRNEAASSLGLFDAAGLVATARPVVINPSGGMKVVSWPKYSGASAISRVNRSVVTNYVSAVSSEAYSCMLMDGALIQIAFGVVEPDVIWHRLCYLPCPIALRVGATADLPVVDYINVLPHERLVDLHRSAGAIRFDYDLREASSKHPASHLTFNNVRDCRIPVSSPIGAAVFMDFIGRQFYPSLWCRSGKGMKHAPLKLPDCLDPTHKGSMHLVCP